VLHYSAVKITSLQISILRRLSDIIWRVIPESSFYIGQCKQELDGKIHLNKNRGFLVANAGTLHLESKFQRFCLGLYHRQPQVLHFLKSTKHMYRKDRLKNSVFLSLSVCTKQFILSGQGHSTQAVFKGTPS